MLKDLMDRLNKSKEIITEPSEYNIDDPSYLPNQQILYPQSRIGKGRQQTVPQVSWYGYKVDCILFHPF